MHTNTQHTHLHIHSVQQRSFLSYYIFTHPCNLPAWLCVEFNNLAASENFKRIGWRHLPCNIYCTQKGKQTWGLCAVVVWVQLPSQSGAGTLLQGHHHTSSGLWPTASPTAGRGGGITQQGLDRINHYTECVPHGSPSDATTDTCTHIHAYLRTHTQTHLHVHIYTKDCFCIQLP